MTKRKLVFLLMLAVLVTSVAGSAGAQFWKKKSKRHHKHKSENAVQNDSASVAPVKDESITRKEKKKKQKEERKKKKQEQKAKKRQEKKSKISKSDGAASTKAIQGSIKKRSSPPAKSNYRVDVLASLYLDELVKDGSATYKDKIPDKALPGVAFYAGISIAADSLKKEGFNIDIYVHDVASFLESPQRLTQLGGLDSSDLIIGAVQPADIGVVADFAKKKAINFISTLSASDGGVRNNMYFTMMQPSLKTHCQWIINDVARKFPGQKVSLLYQTKGPAESSAYDDITDAPADSIHFKYLACNTMPRKENFSLVVDAGKPNIMIVSILDIGFADSLLHELSRDYPGTHFEIYGMPSWTSIEDLRQEGAFPNLAINVTTPFTLDPSTSTGQYVKRMYKQNYTGKISESVFRGYETLFWYAALLKKYGTHFNDKYGENMPAPFTRFDIQMAHDKNGHMLYYENKHIFLATYESGTYKLD